MRILYFGTVCNLSKYESLLERFRVKPTVASVVFETALLDGFVRNDANIEIHSFPMIPFFPNSHLFCFGGQVEELSIGVNCHWLYTINLPYIKQITRRLDAIRVINKWVKENNQDDLVILTYSIPPFLVKSVLKYSRKYNIKTVAIIPDLLKDMYINENQRSFFTKLKNNYLNSAMKLQSEYDGYVYLTDEMHHVVAPNKPYIVMEGIADINNFETTQPIKKASPRAIMYAGMLFEKYGIIELIDAFEQLNDPSVELWLFGDGSAVNKIINRAEINPRIRYFGKVSRSEILLKEKQATLLVNPRDISEDFTKYSFPSKTIEYMLSGTPVLTTRLQGIPKEYFEYVFVAESNKAKSLAKAMNDVLSQSDDVLTQFGEKAKLYIISKKDSVNQVKRILNFIEEV